MEQNDSDALKEFETSLSKITVCEPSANYLAKGRSIIKSSEPNGVKTTWRNMFRLSLSPRVIAVSLAGLIAGMLVSSYANYSGQLAPQSVTTAERKRQAHSLAVEVDSILRATSTKSLSAFDPPGVATERYLVASCEECHSPSFLTELVPSGFDGSQAELARLTSDNIASLLN